jgi:ligand-binding SRPBCC domain-containing protein
VRIFEFRSRLWVPRPRAEVFAFFSDARNLEDITPPWLRFQVVTPQPLEIRAGAEIDYRLKIRGVPVQWRSRISVWEPPGRFVDEQVRGPYRRWVHEHRFTEDSGRTWCEDHVQYAPPGGALVDRLFVRRDVQNIFAYRSQRLRRIFGAGD